MIKVTSGSTPEIVDELYASIITASTIKVAEAAIQMMYFLPFKPGGHCIGVDPYYLTHKAVGYNPEIILAGRLKKYFQRKLP